MSEILDEYNHDDVEIQFIHGCDNLRTGWYVYLLDEHGYAWDSIGPFDTEYEAERAAAKGFSD